MIRAKERTNQRMKEENSVQLIGGQTNERTK